MINRRTKLIEYHGSNRATFECPEGHRYVDALMPKAPNGRFPAEALLRKFASYWTNTGVNAECPRCKRKRKA